MIRFQSTGGDWGMKIYRKARDRITPHCCREAMGVVNKSLDCCKKAYSLVVKPEVRRIERFCILVALEKVK